MNKIQEFKTFINLWLASYQQLNDILENEQKALEKRDYTSLEKLVSEKNILVNQINEQPIPSQAVSQQEFDGQLSNSKITPIKESALGKLNKARVFCLNNVELKTSWEELIELVGECNFKNEVNSKIVQLITTSTKRTFNLIKGFDPDNNLYNSEGNRSLVQHQGRSLIA
ncbi:MAG: hypothetical protein COB38_01065 [Gammaproteobacteria bacterium]|nr:MAG: hypothetical protein COB38_01065 [Gammaproteobacteria bacterium]